MTDWFEFLKAGEIVLTLLGGFVTATVGGFMWWDRRTRSHVATRAADWVAGNVAVNDRIDQVERVIGSVQGDVRDLHGRLGTVETRMQSLASRDDVSRLAERVARMEGVLEQVDGKVDTLYRAAQRYEAG